MSQNAVHDSSESSSGSMSHYAAHTDRTTYRTNAYSLAQIAKYQSRFCSRVYGRFRLYTLLGARIAFRSTLAPRQPGRQLLCRGAFDYSC